MTDNTFAGFGFAEPLSRALTQREYTTPTPIQVQGLPPQLQGRDLMALAETGSGKTAAFLLPILQRYAANPADIPWKGVGALILAPTRELALQIDAEIASLARNMNIRRAVVLGGVSKGPQINALKRGVHILVATPGRLLDHVNMRSCDLSGAQTLVIDEADRMFDMGFIRDIKKIVSLIPHKRRTALFSATMPAEIRNFAKELLTEPVYVDLQPKQMVVDRIDQKVMIVRTAEKQSRLHTILADEACTRVIVFTRTKRGADRVTERLAMAGIGAIAIHGNKAQNARQRALADFTQGHVRVLVATDIAARGIDVSNITHVINFEMPVDAETYVHRIGRTARKGLSGIAISLCDPSERPEIKAIERLMKQSIEVIGDVGGEVLPMPEKRPHHGHDKPRHEGAHRRGPDSRGPKKDGHRKGGFRKPDGEGRDGFRKDARPNRDGDRAPRRDATPAFDPMANVLPADAAPRVDFKRPDFKPRGDRRPEGNSEGRRDGERKFQSRGPRPERSEGERKHQDRKPNDGPRNDFKRQDGDQRSQAPRAEGAGERIHRPHRDGGRNDAPRHEGKRFDGPHRSASGPRAEHGNNGGQRSERPHQGGKPHGDRSLGERSHSDRKGGGDNTWQGQKTPKFLGNRSDGGAPRRRPNAKPAA